MVEGSLVVGLQLAEMVEKLAEEQAQAPGMGEGMAEELDLQVVRQRGFVRERCQCASLLHDADP